MTPSPRAWHQLVLGRMHVALANHLESESVGVVLQSPADISWSDDTLVQPDLFVVELFEARSLD